MKDIATYTSFCWHIVINSLICYQSKEYLEEMHRTQKHTV